MQDSPTLTTLKELKASLLRDIEKLDKAIADLEPVDLKEIDRIANQETLGVYEYKSCITYDEKVLFAIERLGTSNINNIVKYLMILGEDTDSNKLKKAITITINELEKEKKLLSFEQEGISVYTTKQSLWNY